MHESPIIVASAELHKVSVYADATRQIYNEISVLRPFNVTTSSLPLPVWEMLLHRPTANQVRFFDATS